MLKKLFESLDEKVFTPELKETLETQFNEAVEAKATLIAESKIEEKIKELDEASEAYIDELDKKAEEYVDMKIDEMVNSLDKYLERVVDEFVTEASEALDESAKSDKADMIIEAFESFVIATGVDVAKIVEAKDDSDVSAKLDEANKKYDKLVEENIDLKETNEKLIKLGVMLEMSEGLSIIEAEKFKKLADLVEFTNDDEFESKLELIKENVKGSVDKKEEDLNEDDKTDKPAWSHLV